MAEEAKIYVGNLSYNVSEQDLDSHFSQFGEIESVKLIMDRETNRSKGFAFISFADQAAVNDALEQDGQEYQGRNLKVSKARASTGGGGRGGNGGRGGFGGNRGGNNGGGGRW